MLTLDQLVAIMPYAGPRAPVFLPFLQAAMAEFDINTPKRCAPFLANFAHETAQLACMVENLNYSAEGLQRTWPKRFTPALAAQYARRPEKIANYVYANRMGNGSETSGDGWRFRGTGGFQLTGRDNQRQCAERFGIPLAQIGDWLRTPEGACRSAAWVWWRDGCNALADFERFDAICDTINLGRITPAVGDALGYHERKDLADLAAKVLA